MYGRTSSRSGSKGRWGRAARRFVKAANSRAEPSRPGFTKSKIDHRSERRFSTGVPVRAMRARPQSFFAARVCRAPGFLIACASSRTTRSNGVVASQGSRSSEP